MKALFYLPVAALMALAAVSCGNKEKTETPSGPVDYSTRIEDGVFRSFCLQNYDTDADGKLLIGETKAVTEISVHSMGIRSLKGIECFVNLLRLDCSGNNIRSLDLSRNTKLEYLNCQDSFVDYIYLKEGQTIGEIEKGVFYRYLPAHIEIDSMVSCAQDASNPISFDAYMGRDENPETVTWKSDVPSFKEETTPVVPYKKSTLEYSNMSKIGNMEPGKLYNIWAVTDEGVKSQAARFGILGNEPMLFFSSPATDKTYPTDYVLQFVVFFHPGSAGSGKPSIKLVGDGNSKSFDSGVNSGDYNNISWSTPGKKEVITYFVYGSKVYSDTLKLNIIPEWPEIKYVN